MKPAPPVTTAFMHCLFLVSIGLLISIIIVRSQSGSCVDCCHVLNAAGYKKEVGVAERVNFLCCLMKKKSVLFFKQEAPY